ncbi:MAG: hypothetical protein ABSH51_06145 [Solirubrobacteraceae bacterium]|jgi:hypothetical protein
MGGGRARLNTGDVIQNLSPLLWRCAGPAALVTAVLAAGCGQSANHVSRSPVTTPTTTATTQTASSAAAAVRSTVSVRRPAARTDSTAGGVRVDGTMAVIRAGTVIARFAGSGNRVLGSVNARTAVVLQWRASGRPLTLLTAGGFPIVESANGAGRIRLLRGDYRGLRIVTAQRWSVEVRVAL